jgi:predicted small secreted protein
MATNNPGEIAMALISRLLAVVVLVTAGVSLSACHTAAGVGEDVSAAGHAVTHTADKVKDKM